MSNDFENAKCDGDCSSCLSECETKETASGTTLTLQMDNGESVECAILTIFQADEKEYIVLLPLDEDGMADGEEVFIYRYSKNADGTPYLENIADDDEYEKVSAGFEEYLAQVQAEAELSELESTIGTDLN